MAKNTGFAHNVVAALEAAEIAAKAGDARRILRDERVALMSAIQQGDADHVAERANEAKRVLAMWAGY